MLTEAAQFSTQLSVSKTKITIREVLHVLKQMYQVHVNILAHSYFTACGSGSPRIVVIVHFLMLIYLPRALLCRYNYCTRWYHGCTSGTVAIRLCKCHSTCTKKKGPGFCQRKALQQPYLARGQTPPTDRL